MAKQSGKKASLASGKPGKGGGSGSKVLGFGAIVVVFAVLAAISLPGYIGFKPKARQAEAKTNLNAILTGQMSYNADYGNYAQTFDAIDWRPAGGNLYTYYMCGDSIASAKGNKEPLPPDLDTVCDDNRFIAVAVGNIDSDKTHDVWVIEKEKNSLRNVVNDIDQ